MLRPSTTMKRSWVRTAMFIMRMSLRASCCSVTGNALPRHELEAAGAVRDVGLAVGDLLGLGAGRRAEDDHAGAKPVAGVVEKGPRADQDALGLKVMNELVVELGQLLPGDCELGRRVNDLVVDYPALLTFAHDTPSDGSFGRTCNEDSSLQTGSKANSGAWRQEFAGRG